MIQIQKLLLVSIYFINTFYNGSKKRKQYIKYDGLIFVGTVTAGMGISHLNKFLAAMNIGIGSIGRHLKIMKKKLEPVPKKCLWKAVNKQFWRKGG